ncbi:hypothetical protein [Alteribacter aurantiacus]|uniref:hypothetical protein n=1 Tax=Alteribacter aurantiacus TaxID=254410 RepID=UPI000426785C|nr:hypothetical protein [Alteribacter aurantiacus]
MTKHLVATFENLSEAEEAFHELLQIVQRENISFIHKDHQNQEQTSDMTMDHPINGILTGGAIGGVGGALIGASLMAFPGLGVLFVAGPIYAALAGITSGGIIGGLVDLGINRYEAEKIEQHVHAGMIVMTVECELPQEGSVREILHRHQATYITEEKTLEDRFE